MAPKRCHQKVVEEAERVHDQHVCECPLKQVRTMVLQHENTDAKQYGLGEAGDKTKQQQIKNITIHDGKSTFFSYVL